MSVVQIDWKPDARALRSFGRIVIIGCLLIAAFFWFVKDWHLAAAILAGAGLVIGALALTGSRIGLPGYLLWMGIAFVMGSIVSRVILAVVYYLVVTPIGLLMKLTGRDRLALKKPAGDTFWVDLPADRTADHYERQF